MTQSVKKRITVISNELRLGKEGKNTFSNYEYFKPDDILKNLNPLLEKHNLITIFNLIYAGEYYKAQLIIEDTETEQKVEYSFDISKATLKGTNEAQNSGATLTYAKRYSLMNAFNIADNDDDLDSDKMNKPLQKPNPRPQPKEESQSIISKSQAQRLFAIAQGNNDLVKDVLVKFNYTSTKEIKIGDYDKIVNEIERGAC